MTAAMRMIAAVTMTAAVMMTVAVMMIAVVMMIGGAAMKTSERTPAGVMTFVDMMISIIAETLGSAMFLGVVTAAVTFEKMGREFPALRQGCPRAMAAARLDRLRVRRLHARCRAI